MDLDKVTGVNSSGSTARGAGVVDNDLLKSLHKPKFPMCDFFYFAKVVGNINGDHVKPLVFLTF